MRRPNPFFIPTQPQAVSCGRRRRHGGCRTSHSIVTEDLLGVEVARARIVIILLRKNSGQTSGPVHVGAREVDGPSQGSALDEAPALAEAHFGPHLICSRCSAHEGVTLGGRVAHVNFRVRRGVELHATQEGEVRRDVQLLAH